MAKSAYHSWSVFMHLGKREGLFSGRAFADIGNGKLQRTCVSVVQLK